MDARWYLLYRREPRSHDWEDGVTIYEKLYPKQVRRLMKKGWRIQGNRNGDRL
jgi:hypothetical protein